MTLRLGTPDFSDERDIAELADWAELASATSSRSISQGQLQTTLAREGRRDSDPAARAAEVWAELERRSDLRRAAWPLRIAGTRLRPRDGHPNSLFHYFLCSLSLGAEVSSMGRRLFEYCVADVVRSLSGNMGLRIGSPRSGGLPRSLDKAVDLYVRLSRELKRGPLLPTDKDFGLDVVTWRAFIDPRGGYLPYIGQCATGKDWYEDGKLSELQIRSWEDHIAWAVEPVRFCSAVRDSAATLATCGEKGGPTFGPTETPRALARFPAEPASAGRGSRVLPHAVWRASRLAATRFDEGCHVEAMRVNSVRTCVQADPERHSGEVPNTGRYFSPTRNETTTALGRDDSWAAFTSTASQ